MDFQVMLHRVDPARRMWRFYCLDIWPDLFGGALLVRQWGRLGGRGRGQIKIQHFASFAEAERALVRLERTKRKRGYQAVSQGVPEKKGDG